MNKILSHHIFKPEEIHQPTSGEPNVKKEKAKSVKSKVSEKHQEVLDSSTESEKE